MSESEDWTIGKLLEWTKDYLAKHGAESPRLDAEVLLAHARNCQRIELYTAFEEVASEKVRNDFRALVKKRSEGTPVAYLVESREFYSLPFRVSPAVLIPRPETELLVVRLLDLAKERKLASAEDAQLRIVDVGTGSGVVAICAAIYLPSAQIVAIDASESALEIARGNAERHKVLDRIEFKHGDLLEGVDGQFDFIVSNPPYVSEAEYDELDKQVRDYEPREALVGGPNGTELIDKLVIQSESALSSKGWLLMEISPMISDSVKQTVESNAAFDNVRVTPDLAKLPRIVETQRR